MTAAGGRCKLWANKIKGTIGGEIIHIKPRFAQGKYIGPVRTTKGSIISREFTEHFAVRKGDRIYDRNTGPAGLPSNDYKALFDWADDLNFDNIVP